MSFDKNYIIVHVSNKHVNTVLIFYHDFVDNNGFVVNVVIFHSSDD